MTKMTKRLLTGLLVAGALFGMTGCSGAGDGTVPAFTKQGVDTRDLNGYGNMHGLGAGYYSKRIHLEDGRTVYCLRYDRGISCDWENAK